MKKIIITSVFIFIIFISSDLAKASQTLDCFTQSHLIRMHVNSLDQIADMQILTNDKFSYQINLCEIVLFQLDWELNGIRNNGNIIHLKTKSSESGFPAFKLNVIEAKGFLLIEGSNTSTPCQCEWGYK